MACADCGRHQPEKALITEERWPYGNGVRPKDIPSHVRGISLRVCADREACAKHVQARRFSIFMSACQGTGALSRSRGGHYLWPMTIFR